MRAALAGASAGWGGPVADLTLTSEPPIVYKGRYDASINQSSCRSDKSTHKQVLNIYTAVVSPISHSICDFNVKLQTGLKGCIACDCIILIHCNIGIVQLSRCRVSAGISRSRPAQTMQTMRMQFEQDQACILHLFCAADAAIQIHHTYYL